MLKFRDFLLGCGSSISLLFLCRKRKKNTRLTACAFRLSSNLFRNNIIALKATSRLTLLPFGAFGWCFLSPLPLCDPHTATDILRPATHLIAVATTPASPARGHRRGAVGRKSIKYTVYGTELLFGITNRIRSRTTRPG